MQDDPEYDIRGYWDSEGRPGEFNYDQPTEEDGYYHGYSINGNTGEYLKAPTHSTFQHAVDEDRKMGYRPVTNVYGRNIATENESIIPQEQQSFLRNTEGPANYIEADLTPEEIEQYRAGGYIIDELPVAQKGGSQVYTYSDRPEAKYKKDASGNWLISLPSTKGSYVPIKDPTGKRAGELNEKAKPYAPAAPKSNLSSYEDRINKPQVSENTSAGTYPMMNVPAKMTKSSGMDMLKTTPTQLAAANYVKKDKNLSDAQKEDLLFNKDKLMDYVDAVGVKSQESVKQVSKRNTNPYSRERLWDIATNPLQAFKYSVSAGGLENMPYNYNKMKDAGIDPSASSFQERFGYGDNGRGKGSNLVGDALNSTTNLLDAGDKVVRNLKSGNYAGAFLEGLRFIPAAKVASETTGAMVRTGIKEGKNLGIATERTVGKIADVTGTVLKNTAQKTNKVAYDFGKLTENILNTTKPGQKVANVAKSVRKAGLNTIKTTTAKAEQALGYVRYNWERPLIPSKETRTVGGKWLTEEGTLSNKFVPGSPRQYVGYEKWTTPNYLFKTNTAVNAALHAPQYIAKHQRSLEKISENPDEASNYINMGWNMIRYVGDLTTLNKTVDAINTPMKAIQYSKEAYQQGDPWKGFKAAVSLSAMPRLSSSGITQRKEGGDTDINKHRQLLRDWTYGADIGMLQEADGGEYWEDEIDDATRAQLLAQGYQIEDLD